MEKEKQTKASAVQTMRRAVGKGGGGDHQSSAHKILSAAAEGASCFLGGGEGERADA